MGFAEGSRARLNEMVRLLESATGKWVVFLCHKNDPIRWDSKGVQALDKERRFFVFPDDADLPAETADRKIVWRGAAKAQQGLTSPLVALRIASRDYKPTEESFAGLREAAWQPGDSVELVLKDGAKTRGVVTALPKSKGARVSVTDVQGRHWKVNPDQLKAVKLAPDVAAAVQAKGAAFQGGKAAQKGREAESGANAIDDNQFAVGMEIVYKGNTSVIVAVNRDEGTLTIENPKYRVKTMAAGYGYSVAHLGTPKHVLVVSATQVRPK